MAEEAKPKKHWQANIPQKEAGVIDVARSVIEAWEKRGPNWLAWATPEEFKKALGEFMESYEIRSDARGDRSTISKDYAEINSEIDMAVNYVKDYIAEKFSAKTASSYYLHFGMAKSGNSYRIPRDQSRRERALKQMLRGIEQYGLTDRKYGKDYWEDVSTRFEAIRMNAIASDSISAEHINIKTVKKAYIRKVLNSLVYIIKGNCPDTWKEELRVWGFQKEKY